MALIATLRQDLRYVLDCLEPIQSVTVDGFTVDHEDEADALHRGPWEPCPVDQGKAWNPTTGAFLDLLLMPCDVERERVQYLDGDVTNCRRANLRVDDKCRVITAAFHPALADEIMLAARAYGSVEKLMVARCL